MGREARGEEASWFMEGAVVTTVVLRGGDIRLSMSIFTPGEVQTVGLSGVWGERTKMMLVQEGM